MKKYYIFILAIILSGCSVIGKDNTPITSYKVLSKAKNNNIELRVYDKMVLASTPMNKQQGEGRNSAFMKLFDYISGKNISSSKIKMTAPVLMDSEGKKGTKIPMTAPVFMGNKSDSESLMSFVLPEGYTIQTAPKPKDPSVNIHQLENYKVASITFSGLLSQANINKHKAILEKWITKKGYSQVGDYKTAGYNPPFTIPSLRRNEVLIPVNTD